MNIDDLNDYIQKRCEPGDEAIVIIACKIDEGVGKQSFTGEKSK